MAEKVVALTAEVAEQDHLQTSGPSIAIEHALQSEVLTPSQQNF
jgi:hypothetical protein